MLNNGVNETNKTVLGYREFRRNLDIHIKLSELKKDGLYLIIIDIDNFCEFNNKYGYNLGELSLRKAKLNIKDFFRDFLIYRTGDDQFALLIESHSKVEITQLCSELTEYLSFHTKIDFVEESLDYSVGISHYPTHATMAADLIQRAEIALSLAKQRKRKKAIVYKNVLKNLSGNIHFVDTTSTVINTILSIINTRDNYTLGHSQRVAQYSVALGKALKLSSKELEILKFGGLLHDIGKIEIERYILVKNGKLTDDEYKKIQEHPLYGYQIVRGMEELKVYKDIVLFHHERVDGKGYPYGLSGEGIPLYAKIVAICDSYDAMTSNRPYAHRREASEALCELQICAGTQFDEYLVKEFIKMINL